MKRVPAFSVEWFWLSDPQFLEVMKLCWLQDSSKLLDFLQCARVIKQTFAVIEP